MLWGADGVTISKKKNHGTGPRVVEASDGDFVFVWAQQRWDDKGDLVMQRLSPEGTKQLGGNGRRIVRDREKVPAFPDIVATDDGGVIVSWITDYEYTSPAKFLAAEKFTARGRSAWGGPVLVHDEYSLPPAYRPVLQPDGEGGAILLWHGTPLLMYTTRVQRLDARGNERLPHGGLPVSTETTRHHIAPAMVRDPDTGDVLVFWEERNAAQSMWGVRGQRISPAGTRLWGDEGAELLPIDSINKHSLVALPHAGGAMVYLLDQPTGVSGEDRLVGLRVDGDGVLVWAGSPIDVSSFLSLKTHLDGCVCGAGVAKLVWDDERDGDWSTVDVYGQNVNPDGSLGN
jgi:hypothetical protein